jgi:nitroreductase
MNSNAAPTDHAIHDLLRERWSPRAFAPRDVETDKLARLLEAARWAPSSYNEQPWHFLVATRDQPAEFERMLGVLWEGNQAWAKDAPVLVITAARKHFARGGKPNLHAWHDVGQAIAHLSVQATAEGLVVHQMMGFDAEAARTVYGIPDDHEAVTAVAIGYIGDPASLPEPLRERELAPRERRPLADFVFTGNWGASLRLPA